MNIFSSKTIKRQSQLNGRRRSENVKNKIKLLKKPPRNLIIIDDVYTTGSTMNEIGNLILDHCDIIVGLTMAKTF